jgi:hypothetical protein
MRLIAPLLGTLRDMMPILLTVAVFEGIVLGRIPPDLPNLVVGLMAVLIGLTLMVRGLEASLFPVGEALADAMARRGHPAWLLGFAFALGFGSTVAEPALAAVAAQAAAAMAADSEVDINPEEQAAIALSIRYGIAVSLGLALVMGVWRTLKGWSIIWLILPGYGLIAIVSLLSDTPAIAVSLDLGTAATSVINIPLMLALGIGLATVLRSRSPLADGFGIVVLASLTPMLVFTVVSLIAIGGG